MLENVQRRTINCVVDWFPDSSDTGDVTWQHASNTFATYANVLRVSAICVVHDCIRLFIDC